MRELKRIIRRALARGVVPACYYAIKRVAWRLNKGVARSLEPKVTVVLPVYNVESYLADAVNSILGQGWGNLDLIAVNDGATDGSLKILEKIAKRDPRLRIHTKVNGGLGAARNTGVSLIKDTDYLLFVDSDDILPLGTIKRYVEALEHSSSPLVIGRPGCFYGARYFDRPGFKSTYAKNRREASINEIPDVVGDLTAWNKFFKWDFYKGAKFPEGIRYEDMTLMMKLLLKAPSIDVVAARQYAWRVRGEGESLSKMTTELKSLNDRIGSMREIVAMLKKAVKAGRIDQAVYQGYLSRAITLDFQLFAPAIEEANLTFFAAFKLAANELLRDADETVWANASGQYKDIVREAITGSRASTVRRLQESRR
jgi:CDP-glycerol glycerophosphotransferase